MNCDSIEHTDKPQMNKRFLDKLGSMLKAIHSKSEPESHATGHAAQKQTDHTTATCDRKSSMPLESQQPSSSCDGDDDEISMATDTMDMFRPPHPSRSVSGPEPSAPIVPQFQKMSGIPPAPPPPPASFFAKATETTRAKPDGKPPARQVVAPELQASRVGFSKRTEHVEQEDDDSMSNSKQHQETASVPIAPVYPALPPLSDSLFAELRTACAAIPSAPPSSPVSFAEVAENSAKPGDKPPKSEDKPPKFEDNPPKSEDKPPKSEDNPPKLEDKPPKTRSKMAEDTVERTDTESKVPSVSMIIAQMQAKMAAKTAGTSEAQPTEKAAKLQDARSNNAAPRILQTKLSPTYEQSAIAEESAKQFKISVQLAHGSPTHTVQGFANIDELYKSIAKTFDIKAEDIIFCTVNTVKNDMDKLFCGQLGVNDLLFVHLCGQPVELSLTKTEECLGLSVADNGWCRTFIKRIKPGTICARAQPALSAGQQIAKINGECVLGRRHHQVAKMLRKIPINSTFTLRLISPLASGFSMLLPRGVAASAKRGSCAINDGMKTLRFKSDGKMVVEEEQTDRELVLKLDAVLDEYLGVQDEQLAHSILDVVLPCATIEQLSEVIKQSDLKVFEFPDELVFDVWGIVGDWKREQQK